MYIDSKKIKRASIREKSPEGHLGPGQRSRHSLAGRYSFYKSWDKILLKEKIGETSLRIVGHLVPSRTFKKRVDSEVQKINGHLILGKVSKLKSPIFVIIMGSLYIIFYSRNWGDTYCHKQPQYSYKIQSTNKLANPFIFSTISQFHSQDNQGVVGSLPQVH